MNEEKLKKKPVQKPVGTGVKKPGQGQFNNRGRNNRNKNKQKFQPQQQVQATKRKERELPEKITFYESLTVRSLPRNFTVNLLKSLRNYLCLVLWQQSTKH